MRFLDKLGLAIFSIITLVLSIVLCLIAFGWMESTIFSVLIGKVLISQTYTYILIAVCFLLILLAIRCIFFSESKEEESDDGILLQNEDGKLLITVATLKDMVEGVINDFANITDSAVGVVITKENDIIINVSIDVTKETIIKDVSSKLQIKVKKVIKEATDLDILSVNVRVKNADTVLDVSKTENVKENKSETAEKIKKSVNEGEKVVKKEMPKKTNTVPKTQIKKQSSSNLKSSNKNK